MKRGTEIILRNERGQAALPFIAASVILLIALFSILALRFRLRADVETQRRLDQCVQKKAKSLVRLQNALEIANDAMIAARATMMLFPAPPVYAAASAANTVAFGIQLALEANYYKDQALWIVRRGCDGKKDLPLPLPQLKWKRGTADNYGPKPLEWDGDRYEDGMNITLSRGKRISHATVRAKNIITWRADWTAPLGNDSPFGSGAELPISLPSF